MRSKGLFWSILTILAVAFVFFADDASAGKKKNLKKLRKEAKLEAAAAALAVPNYNIVFLGDGALQSTAGGWNLPAQGTCPAGTANGYTGIDTRPECVALRLPFADSTSCAATGSGRAWTTSGVCNDLVNTNQAACIAAGDRLWNPGTSVCSIVMNDDDRNNVTCALHGGTWVTAGTCTGSWTMPATTTYMPKLLTGTGPGDQCLRCHNTRTQYNGPRVRDTEDTLYMGHKNMSRKVNYCSDPTYTTEGACTGGGATWIKGPWGGPDFSCSNPTFTNEEDCIQNGASWNPTIYPSDDTGNAFNWSTGQITVNSNPYDLTWIYGDWLAALPRAIYKAPASATQVCSDPRGNASNCVSVYGGTMINNAGASYSCARCHTTGWSSDGAIQATKEPERSYPGITWDRNSHAGFGVVNLSPGVSGDPNKYASWDSFGITCSRCHSSAIDKTTNGGIPPHSAPAGMSSHHNNLTTPDAGNGVCTDIRWTAEAQCTSNGGSWLTGCTINPTPAVCTVARNTAAACAGDLLATWVPAPGWCSNAFFTDQTSCTTNGFTWQDGWCTRPDLISSATCTGGSGSDAKSWRLNGSQASCNVAGAGWSLASCSVAGVCNLGSLYTDKASCEAAPGGQFAFATDIIRCEDAGGRWTGTNTYRGQLITSVCMDCHRQETTGLPNDGGADPAGLIKVGAVHGTVDYALHPHGNMFLNSAHGEFTGTFATIGTSKFGAGYGSDFMNFGEAKNTGNGCTGCHDVHSSTVAGVEPFHAECATCHVTNDPEMASIPQINMAAINHLAGPGTPMEHSNPSESCVTCHMPNGEHLWRINTSAAYSTFPIPAAMSTVVNANTAPDGAYTKAVWVDIDAACGQCHGGGVQTASTTANTTAGNKTVTVASTLNFLPNERIRIEGAGSLYYDEEGVGKRTDFDSYIVSIGPGTLTLAGAPTFTVSGNSLVQNPTTDGAAYRTKAALAAVAVGMHNAAAENFAVTFNTTISGLKVDVDAVVGCGGTCPPFTYKWNWNDNTAFGTGDPDSHIFTTAGTKSITLTVYLNGLEVDTVTRTMNLTATDLPPVIGHTCTWDANTWTMQLVDSSTDDGGSLQVSVDWGDGTLKSFGSQGGTFNHTYLTPGTYDAIHKVIDSKLQFVTLACDPQATPSYFQISGTVKSKTGVNLGSAAVTLIKGTTTIKTVYSAANGTFTFANLKPGNYNIRVIKSGYTFTYPAATATIGPSATGIVISATAP